MAPSIWQLAIVAVLLILLFGRGKISGLMGDLAQGITSFKKGLREEQADKAVTADAQPVELQAEKSKG